MSRKLILPAEARVCATCSYWDGERHVDTEVGVVVVADNSAGECLVRESNRPGLFARFNEECTWEHMAPDDVPSDEPPGED